MRLSKNFGLSTFPVFRHFQTFDSQKYFENIHWGPGIGTSTVTGPLEHDSLSVQLAIRTFDPSGLDIRTCVKNIPEFSKIDDICRKLTVIFQHF